VAHALKVSLEDLYNGKTSKLALQKSVLCSGCDGIGGKKGSVTHCKACDGRGVVMKLRQIGPGMVQQIQQACSTCGGEGEIVSEKDRCKKCSGKKVTTERKVLEVFVEKGMMHEQKVTFRGEGDQTPGVTPGDVIIVLDQKDHPVFRRERDNLHMEMEIELVEALCGFQRIVKHLDGRELLITLHEGDVVKDGSTKVVLNEGMPHYKDPQSKGHLLITFKVNYPQDSFGSADVYAKLREILPPAPSLPDYDADATEEFDLSPYEDSMSRRRTGAHGHDSDEDEEGHGGGGVQCQQS
jgi:DnaJ-class molecular chaperone